MKLLGRDDARELLAVLELPDDNRLAFISSMYQRDDGQALAEVLAERMEEDLRQDAGAADRGAARRAGLAARWEPGGDFHVPIGRYSDLMPRSDNDDDGLGREELTTGD